MDILIESTKEFEQDLEKFSNTEKFKIIKKLNRYVELLSKDKNLIYQNSTQLREIMNQLKTLFASASCLLPSALSQR
ncbi:MAG: hypothetical protein KME59_06455 [Trichormus sp. ATA11-4-KO1]|jgi:hypothetical protein|nr:hypothetical protein [Trichormus sp. ATA11-4-KO1]